MAELVDVVVKRTHASDSQLYRKGEDRQVSAEQARQLEQGGYVEIRGKSTGPSENKMVKPEEDKDTLPERFRDTLRDAGYDAERVKTASDDDLLAIGGIGPAALKEIRKALK